MTDAARNQDRCSLRYASASQRVPSNSVRHRQLTVCRPTLVVVMLTSIICTAFAGQSSVANEIPIADVERPGPVLFEKDVLPLLRQNCLACHSTTERQGELVLETRADILKGGDSGPAIVPGKPEESLLLKLAAHQQDPVMPPEDNEVAAKNLTSEQLGLISLWIRQGARAAGKMAILSPERWNPVPQRVQPVHAVSLTADGNYVACARGSSVSLYHVASGQLVTHLSDPALASTAKPNVAHRDLVQSVCFNRDGDLLVSGGFREIKLWRRPRDVQLRTIAVKTDVPQVHLSPDRKLMAILDTPQSIRIVDTSTGTAVGQTLQHPANVVAFRFSPTGQHLVSATTNRMVYIRSVPDGQEAGVFETTVDITDVQPVPLDTKADSQEVHPYVLAIAGSDYVISIWTLQQASQPSTAPTADQPDAAGTSAASPSPVKAGFVWQQTAQLTGHSQQVTCLAAIPARPMELLSGSRDGTVRWWQVSGPRQLRQFSVGRPVQALAVSPDGSTVATASDSGPAYLWKNTGQRIAELKGDIRALDKVAATRRQLASAQARVKVARQRLSDAENDIPKKTDAQTSAAQALEKANKDVADKQQVVKSTLEARNKAEAAALAAAREVRAAQEAVDAAQLRIETATLKLQRLQQKQKQILAAANAAPGNAVFEKLMAETQLAVRNAQQTLNQENAAVREPMNRLKAAVNKAAGVASEVDKTQKPYTDALDALRKAQQQQNLAAQQAAVADKELQDAQKLLPFRKQELQQAEERQRIAEEAAKAAEEAAKGLEKPFPALCFSPDGKTLLTGGASQRLHTWDATTGTALQSWEGHGGPVSAVEWMDAETLISAAADGTVRLWAANPQWRLERTIGAVDDADQIVDRVTALHFSPDSKLIVAGSGIPSRSGQLSVFRTADGERVLHLPDAHDDVVYGARFSPDGSRIATCGADRYLRTFDTAAGTMLRRFEGHTNYVLCVDWKSDGQVLASGSADNSIKIWDAETADQRRTVSNLKRHVTAIRFLADTDDVFCVCGDGVARIIRTTNGSTLRNFSGAEAWLHCASVNADGKLVVAGDAAGVVYVWDATNGRLLHRLQ